MCLRALQLIMRSADHELHNITLLTIINKQNQLIAHPLVLSGCSSAKT